MVLKKVVISLLTFVILLSAINFKIFADNAESKPILISTAQALMNMEKNGDYYLACDIDLSDVKWKPVYGFSGTFDGNGYEIKGLTSTTYGLFASLNSGASIKNVKLADVYIASKFRNIGAIASIIQKSAKNVTIDGCYVSGVVASCRTKYGLNHSSTAGSIIGVNNSSSSSVVNCYSDAVVSSERVVGGIVGTNKGVISDCGFGGYAVNSYNVYELGCDLEGFKFEDYVYAYVIGGICGFNYGKVTRCFNNCTVLEEAVYYGGIAGALQGNGEISCCVNSSKVGVDDYECGGLIAGVAGKKTTLNNCYTKMPANGWVEDDVGKTNLKTVTYGVPDERYGKITSFKRLGEGWEIVGGAPVIKKLSEYVNKIPVWIIKGERLVKNVGR